MLIAVYIGILLVFAYSIYAQYQVSATFRRYSVGTNHFGWTAAEIAEKILQKNGVYDVRIERVAGNLTDHYDPRNKTLRLSESVYSSTSPAAIGVAAHEAGHAIQFANNYVPVKIRTAIVPVVQFGSYAFYLFLILGLIFTYPPLTTIGIVCFAATTFFQFVTLPVEFNASRRAMTAISDGGYLTKEEQGDAKKVLRAAAMTYVAAFAASLLQLLRLILIFGNNRRNDR